MKKLSVYIMAFIATTMFVACDEDFKDWADPQTNPQEEQVKVTFQVANASSTVFDLNEITTETIELAKQSSLELEEGSTVTYTLIIASDDEFADKLAGYELSESGGTFNVATSDLQDAIVALFGKRPEERALNARVNAYVKEANGLAFLAQSNTLLISATPLAPVIESAYYVTGDIVNGWGEDYLQKFSHSGKDIYEDPIFVLTINNPANATNFKIIPQSGIDGGDFFGSALGTAVDGDDSLEGTIVAKGENEPGAINIAEKGWVRITLDMMEYSYTIEPLGEMARALYVPGGYQSWSPATASTIYTQNLDFNYDGYVNIIGDGWGDGFKFINGPAWPNAENGYKDYGTDPDGDPGNLAGGNNVTVDEAGFYRLTVDLSGSPYTYTATKTIWGLIGDATPNGWDASTAMTLDAAKSEWSVTVALTEGEFKFRANDGWDINLGGDINNLTYGGDNISVDEGTYTITLKLGDPSVYTAIVVKQ